VRVFDQGWGFRELAPMRSKYSDVNKIQLRRSTWNVALKTPLYYRIPLPETGHYPTLTESTIGKILSVSTGSLGSKINQEKRQLIM
jgi:hypothetical protein